MPELAMTGAARSWAALLLGLLFLTACGAEGATLHATEIPHDTTAIHTTGDGMLRVMGFSDSNATVSAHLGQSGSWFGVVGGAKDHALGEDETLKLQMAAEAGLAGIGFVWTRSWIRLSGFTADPGFTDPGGHASSISYAGGVLTFFYPWDSGTAKSFTFANPGASAGGTIQMNVYDTNPNWQVGVTHIDYNSATPVPAILSFSSTATNRMPAGSSVDLNWQVTNHASVSLLPAPGDVSSVTTNGAGQLTVTPTETSVYTLQITGEGGETNRQSVTVGVGTAPFPNVVLFFLDDFGWADWQQNGAPDGSVFYETPSMDELAGEGLYFPHGYASSPVCSPTRGALMSGQHPARSKLTDWISGSGDAGQPIQEAEWIKKLDLDVLTLPEALGSAGYRTIHVGKWHLGSAGTPEADPLQQGFDVNIGGNYKGHPGSYYFADASGSFDLPNLGSGTAAPGDYLTDILTDKANEQIALAASEGRPFFMYFAHYAVHTPLLAPSATVAKYTAKLGSPPPGGWLGHENATYAAMIEHVDISLSNLVARLEDPDGNGNPGDSIAGNTLIIFTSDNGGLLSATSNRPLRGGKGHSYEGGVREPLVIWWPGRIPPGVTQEPAISYDYYPTILAAAELPPDPDYGHLLDGQDLTPLLFGSGTYTRTKPLIFHYPHYSPQGSTPASAVRLGDWKMLHRYETGGYELYDLVGDPGETTDESAAETTLAATSSRTLIRRLEDLEANYPRSLGDVPLQPTPLVAPGTDADGDQLLDVNEDADGDGLLGPLPETDPDDADTDDDTTPDGAEQAIGTDPRDGASFLEARIETFDADHVSVSWPSLPGTAFTVDREVAPGFDSWTAVATNIPAADPGSNTAYQLAATGVASALVRVGLEGF